MSDVAATLENDVLRILAGATVAAHIALDDAGVGDEGAKLADRLRVVIDERDALRAEVERLASDVAKVRADRDRLAKWLADIEGGDNPCDDAATLRRWAYEAVTFGKEVSDV